MLILYVFLKLKNMFINVLLQYLLLLFENTPLHSKKIGKLTVYRIKKQKKTAKVKRKGCIAIDNNNCICYLVTIWNFYM
jgi:hypothetical protein